MKHVEWATQPPDDYGYDYERGNEGGGGGHTTKSEHNSILFSFFNHALLTMFLSLSSELSPACSNHNAYQPQP